MSRKNLREYTNISIMSRKKLFWKLWLTGTKVKFSISIFPRSYILTKDGLQNQIPQYNKE